MCTCILEISWGTTQEAVKMGLTREGEPIPGTITIRCGIIFEKRSHSNFPVPYRDLLYHDVCHYSELFLLLHFSLGAPNT